MKRATLRRAGWILLFLAAGTLLVVGILVANVDRLARRALSTAIAAQTGTGVRLDGVELGFRDSSFRIRNLVISNPPGFGPQPLLILPELFLAYDPAAAASNRVRFREVRVHLEELHVEVDATGRTNLLELAGSVLRSRGVDPGRDPQEDLTRLVGGFQFEEIQRLSLTLGRVTFADSRDPRRNLTIGLEVTNRTFQQVTSTAQLMPLALEIALRAGVGGKTPAPPLKSSP